MSNIMDEVTPLRKGYSTVLETFTRKPGFWHSLTLTQGPPILSISPGATYSVGDVARWIDEEITPFVVLQSGAANWPMYRAVSLDSLDHVLRTGIDVVPTDAAIWAADDPKKAMEYGGNDKAILVLDGTRMKRSFCELESNASPEAIMATELVFGSDFDITTDGARWYSRLPRADRRRCSAYEIAYGWYVPGNPSAALAAVIIVRAG
jgi:hypothetical protein